MRLQWIGSISLACAVVVLGGCGGGDSPAAAPAPPAAATLSSISVTPANSSALAGATVQLTATGNYSNGTTQNLTSSVAWTTSAAGVATVSSSGLATGTGPGMASITATMTGVGGSTNLTLTSPAISGTAAAGLPLVGTVTVKDSSSPAVTKTVPIGANGSYTVDVWGLKAPLVLRAEGNVGTTHYVMHSATTDISANGTLNITPLTDLIIDDIAGQVASNYFDSGNFSGLTKAALDAESAALKAKLLPVLQAMKVDAAIDLLRTPFTPLASALDSALEVISVSVDPATHVATITNLVNLIAITDDITVPAAAEGTPPTLAADGTAAAADDLPKIRKAATDFLDLFKTSLPQPAALLAMLSDGFLNNDQGRTAFANERASASQLIGARFTDITVGAIDYHYNNDASPLAFVGFTTVDKNGKLLSYTDDFTMIRGTDGVWRLNGNQSPFDIAGNVMMVNSQVNGCKASGIEFAISDEDGSNSATIDHVLVIGPGLPAIKGLPDGTGFLRYNRNTQGGGWRIDGTNNPYWYPMTGGCNHFWGDAGMTDAAIAAIPDNAFYFIKAYSSTNVELPMGPYGSQAGQTGGRSGIAVRIPKRPLTLVELNASTQFPTFTTSVSLATYSGGPITINATGVNPAQQGWAYLGLTDGSGVVNSIDEDVIPGADGTFSKTFSLPNPGTIAEREIRVSSRDAYDRGFMSSADYK